MATANPTTLIAKQKLKKKAAAAAPAPDAASKFLSEPAPPAQAAARKAKNKEQRTAQSLSSVEDAAWLSSLSEPELDFLISFKELAITRAKNAGHKDIAEKFDARMLRSLGTILLDHF